MQLRSGLPELELPRSILEAVAGRRLLTPRRLPPQPGGAAGL